MRRGPPRQRSAQRDAALSGEGDSGRADPPLGRVSSAPPASTAELSRCSLFVSFPPAYHPPPAERRHRHRDVRAEMASPRGEAGAEAIAGGGAGVVLHRRGLCCRVSPGALGWPVAAGAASLVSGREESSGAGCSPLAVQHRAERRRLASGGSASTACCRGCFRF
ncbi:GSK3B-interacting protein isoform 2-T2 [Ara ararauna]